MSGTPREREEQARVRRRWLTLGELLAIAAVVISGLTLWNSYSERTHSEAERRAGEARTARAAAVLHLHGAPDDEGRILTLTARDGEQAIEGQTISLPGALDLSPVETTGDARIERGWFEEALVRARKAAGLKQVTGGDARLPVLIVTRFAVGGDTVTDRSVYLVGYATESGFLSGTHVRLRGLSRVGPAKDDAAGRRQVDALWAAQVPRA